MIEDSVAKSRLCKSSTQIGLDPTPKNGKITRNHGGKRHIYPIPRRWIGFQHIYSFWTRNERHQEEYSDAHVVVQ